MVQDPDPFAETAWQQETCISLRLSRLSCLVQYVYSPQAGLLAADRLDSQQYKIKLSCKPLSLSLVCPASDLYIVYCNGPGRLLCSDFLRSSQHVLEWECTLGLALGPLR